VNVQESREKTKKGSYQFSEQSSRFKGKNGKREARRKKERIPGREQNKKGEIAPPFPLQVTTPSGEAGGKDTAKPLKPRPSIKRSEVTLARRGRKG